MKRWPIFLVTVLILTWALAVPFGCDNDDDDDDDDGPPSYGQDIEGTYTVTMSVEEDDCSDALADDIEWIVRIEQAGDFGQGTVWVTEAGANDEYELFAARVYGTAIVKADIEEIPQGGENCVKFKVQNYIVDVNLDEGTVSGRLTDDIFYEGNGCDNSSVDCHSEKILTP
jgi:hypothetical protein